MEWVVRRHFCISGKHLAPSKIVVKGDAAGTFLAPGGTNHFLSSITVTLLSTASDLLIQDPGRGPTFLLSLGYLWLTSVTHESLTYSYLNLELNPFGCKPYRVLDEVSIAACNAKPLE